MSSDLVGLKRILENSNDNIIKVCTTLINILSKIISKPNETENRRIRLDSSDVIENLMPFSGGLEVLFEIGFQEVISIMEFKNIKKTINFFIIIFRKVKAFSCHLT